MRHIKGLDSYDVVESNKIAKIIFDKLKAEKFKKKYGFELKLAEAAPAMLNALRIIVSKRNSLGWDAECAALQAEEAIKKAT